MAPESQFERWLASVPWMVWALIIANLIWAGVQWQASVARDASQATAIDQIGKRIEQLNINGSQNLQEVRERLGRLQERQNANMEAIQYLQRQHDWLVQLLTPHTTPPALSPKTPYKLQSTEPSR